MTTIRDKQYDLLIQQSDEYMQDVHELSFQGYRPRTCFHGTSLWTEYDNICGACEDGDYDPRYHSEDSEDFQRELDYRVDRAEYQERLDQVIRQIQDEAPHLKYKTDLIKFRATVNVLTDMLK